MPSIRHSTTWTLVVMPALGAILLFFQNCAPMQFDQPELIESDMSLCLNCADIQSGAASCSFNDQVIEHGGSIIAFLNSQDSACQSQTRMCNNGVLSGSYEHPTCVGPSEPAACLFNGKSVANGESVRAFLNASGDCRSEDRICTNGNLSGSYSYASCSNSAVNSPCLFGDKTITHGSAVPAFQAGSVPYGQVCKQEFRICSNGELSGSFTHQSCTAGGPASCSFNGRTLAHGASVTAYQTSTVGYGSSCRAETRTCTNGQLSGSYNFASCDAGSAASCLLNGQTLAHGQSIKAYPRASVPYGSSCTPETRVCNNGQLSGSSTLLSCSVETANSCNFNGQTLAHGQSVVTYARASVPYGSSCTPETRVCNNGQLSGSSTLLSCSVETANSCNFNGQTLAHGQSVVTYAKASVPYGQTCVPTTRVCSNGSLSGSGTNTSCRVENAAPGTGPIEEVTVIDADLICDSQHRDYSYNSSRGIANSTRNKIVSLYWQLNQNLGRCADIPGYKYWINEGLKNGWESNWALYEKTIRDSEAPYSETMRVVTEACVNAAKRVYPQATIISASFVKGSRNKCNVLLRK